VTASEYWPRARNWRRFLHIPNILGEAQGARRRISAVRRPWGQWRSPRPRFAGYLVFHNKAPSYDRVRMDPRFAPSVRSLGLRLKNSGGADSIEQSLRRPR